MHNHCISNLLNVEDVIVKKISHADTYVKIYLETMATELICPCCGAPITHIHDYRTQIIKDLPFQFKNCYLVLKKRRYACKCGKRFYEKYQCILVDPVEHKVLDLLPDRTHNHLVTYFSSISKQERHQVKYFGCDM